MPVEKLKEQNAADFTGLKPLEDAEPAKRQVSGMHSYRVTTDNGWTFIVKGRVGKNELKDILKNGEESEKTDKLQWSVIEKKTGRIYRGQSDLTILAQTKGRELKVTELVNKKPATQPKLQPSTAPVEIARPPEVKEEKKVGNKVANFVAKLQEAMAELGKQDKAVKTPPGEKVAAKTKSRVLEAEDTMRVTSNKGGQALESEGTQVVTSQKGGEVFDSEEVIRPKKKPL